MAPMLHCLIHFFASLCTLSYSEYSVRLTSFEAVAGKTESSGRRVSHVGEMQPGSRDEVFDELCSPHKMAHHATCVDSFRKSIALHSHWDSRAEAQEKSKQAAKKLEEAKEFVKKMFKTESNTGPWWENNVQSNEDESFASCKQRFSDLGSLVRCLVLDGHLRRAMTEASKYVKAKQALELPAEQRPTYVLLCFASAHLADRLGSNKKESRSAFEDRVVLKYKYFMRVSGQLHIWNDQLGLLMQYGAWRLRQLKPSYDADLYFVKTKTNPSFIVAPLHPLKDTHVSTDMLKGGTWEESTSALVAWSLQSYTNADSTEPCVLIDVGANIGWFSLLGAALGCQSIAFEPVAEHCQQIRLGFAASGLPESQLILHQSGALSTTTKVAVNKFDIGPAATSYVIPADNTDDKRSFSGVEPTVSVRIDEVVLKHLESTSGDTCSAHGCEKSNLARVRAIKIDAEGCELEAFVSAEAILRPFADAYNSSLQPPDVFVELCPDMLARCPGDWKQTLQQSAEIFEALYPQRLYVYHFHGHGLERSWATGLEPSHQYPSDIPWSDWGVDPKYTKQGVHELRVDASGFVEYVEVLAKEAKGCFYLWAVSGRELEPI